MENALLIILATSAIGLIFWKHIRAERKEAQQKLAPQPQEVAAETHPVEITDEPDWPLEAEDLKDMKTMRDYTDVNRAFRKADLHLAKGNLTAAERWLVKTLSLFPEHQEVLNRLGVLYVQQGQYKKAEAAFRKLLDLNQKEAIYFSNFGRCLYSQGRLQEAASAYRKAIDLDEKRPNRRVSLGQVLFEMRQFDAAMEQFIKAYESDRRNLGYMGHLADLYEVAGNTEKLKGILEKMLELDPYNEKLKERLEKVK